MKTKERKEAVRLREEGNSLKEISELLQVSKSSVSLWVSAIELNQEAKTRLSKKITNGQIISAKRKKERTKAQLSAFYDKATEDFDSLGENAIMNKFFCSLLYICEGGKHGNAFVQFTNSDPKLIQSFLKLLLKSFKIEAEKFRVCVHLHDYHNVERQLRYWSQVSQIPRTQFIKPYIKKSEHHNIHNNYQGCCQIRYYSSEVNKELTMSGLACLDKIIGS